MPYIGNIPATQFAALTYQDLTGGSGTSFTLDTSVGSAQDIEVFVNNVRQEPGVAYTISGGTTLNMTGTIASTDDFYVVFQGKAVGTVTHPPLSALQATTGTFSSNVDVGGSLFVDTIKESTGTNTGISINSSGYVTTPNRPFVSAAWNGSGTTVFSSPISQFTTYNTSDTNMGSGNTKMIYKDDYSMLNTTTGFVTVPVSGIYLIVGHYSTSTAGTEGRRIGHLFITPSGGSQTNYGEWCESYGTYDDTVATKLLSLNANDQISFGYNTAVINWDAFGFEITLLG